MKTRNWFVLTAAAMVLALGMVTVHSTARAQSQERQMAEEMAPQIRLYRDLLGLIKDYADIAADASTAGVTAVLSVEDHLPEVEDQINFLEERADIVRDPVVARAIRMKLIDLYENSNAPRKKRLEQLDRLINP